MKSGHRLVKLEDLCSHITDGKHGDCQNEELSGYYFLSCKDVFGGKLNYENARQITKADFVDTHRRTKLEPNDILITNSGTIGRMAIAPQNDLTHRTTFQKSVAILKPVAAKVQPRFLYYLIQGNLRQLTDFAGGTAQKNLLLRDLRAFEVKLPLLETQRKISSILSAYDDLIENNTRRIKILEEMAQAVYREWFVNFRFPGHEQVRMVDSPLGRVPEGWGVVSLQDVCDRITDGAHKSPPTQKEGYPMASVKDMHDYGLDVQGCRKISEDDFNDLVRNDCKVKKGDVLIAKDGSYLKHCFAVEKDLDVVLLSSIAMLRPNEKMRPHLLAHVLKNSVVKERMRGYVSGVAIPRIVLKDFRGFQIVRPPNPIQKQWGLLVEPMLVQCWRLIDKNENLRQTRDLLLPKLISGEVEVSELAV